MLLCSLLMDLVECSSCAAVCCALEAAMLSCTSHKQNEIPHSIYWRAAIEYDVLFSPWKVCSIFFRLKMVQLTPWLTGITRDLDVDAMCRRLRCSLCKIRLTVALAPLLRELMAK